MAAGAGEGARAGLASGTAVFGGVDVAVVLVSFGKRKVIWGRARTDQIAQSSERGVSPSRGSDMLFALVGRIGRRWWWW